MVYGTLYNGDPCPGRVFSSTVYKLLMWWTWADFGYTVTAPRVTFRPAPGWNRTIPRDVNNRED